MTEYELRSPAPEEFEAWYALYRPYSLLMGDAVDRDIAQTVWGWIQDPEHATEAIVAFSGGTMVGFTHYRPFPRTLHGNAACFLDDLYVADEVRGCGLGRRLIEAVSSIAHERGWSHVRWVAAQVNVDAQRLYDRIAQRMQLLTYRTPPEEGR